MSKNQPYYPVCCTLESGAIDQKSEWTYEAAVERACKLVDGASKKAGGEGSVKIDISCHYIQSQRKPRTKFTEQVPLDKSRSKSKLYRLRRKQRDAAAHPTVAEPEPQPTATTSTRTKKTKDTA